MRAILDRYIIKHLFQTFVFSLIALCVIFLIVNLLENLDEFLDRDVSYDVIILYYIYFLPEILKILTPVALLVSTLFTIGRLSTLNEITAMKTSGISLYRIMMPLITFAIVISLGQLYFNGWIVPKSMKKKLEIEQTYLHKRISGGPIYNLYFRDDPLTNVSMQYYSAKNKTGSKISIEKYSSLTKPRLIKRLEAKRMTWDSLKSSWVLYSGIQRSFNNLIKVHNFDSLLVKLNLTNEKIVQLQKSPEEMNFDEMKEYIQILKDGGKDVRKQLIEYYGNYAFPFANLIVVLFAVPFASVRRRGGLAVQIAAALTVSFFYLVFSKISQTMGFAIDINPILAGWGANIIFLILGLYTIIKVKT